MKSSVALNNHRVWSVYGTKFRNKKVRKISYLGESKMTLKMFIVAACLVPLTVSFAQPEPNLGDLREFLLTQMALLATTKSRTK